MLRGKSSGQWLVARKRDPRADRPTTTSGTQITCPTLMPFALSSLFRMLSPIIPVHPRGSPVSPIIPVHTQEQGGGGCPLQNTRANNSFVFSRHVNYMLNSMSNYIVGAPTFLECGGLPPLLRLTKRSVMNGLGETDGIAKAGASSRTPRPATASTTG